MRKHLSISWVLASDAACFIGGLLAGAVAIHLLQSAPLPNAMGSLWQVVQPSFDAVNRAGKADRGDLIPFAVRVHRALTADALRWLVGPRLHKRFGMWLNVLARILLQVDPAANTTTVPKGEVSSGRPPGSIGESAEKPQGARPEPSLLKAVGCESVASPLVEPRLARFVGRCLTLLSPPTGSAPS